MIDPYPEMTLDYALKLLKKQYGPASVIHWRVSNTIAVCLMPTGEPSPVSVQLTIEQAKFLAANLMSPEHLLMRDTPTSGPGEVTLISRDVSPYDPSFQMRTENPDFCRNTPTRSIARH